MLANDCFFNEKICPVCGKIFVYYPDHVYKIRVNYHDEFVCSWKCERKWENDLQSNNRNFRNGTEKFV